MLAVTGVEVKRCGIRYIAARLVGNNSNVVTDLALIWITLKRIKCIARLNIRRPGHAGVSAKGIK